MNDTSGLTPENQQALEWKTRMIEWLAPRIKADSKEEQEQFLAMWFAATDQSYVEGIAAAAYITKKVFDAYPTKELGTVHSALLELMKKSRMKP